MNQKKMIIDDLIEKISLEISVLEAAGISLKSQVHNSILHALMSIYLNCLPGPKMEGEEIVAAYEADEKDKKREELKSKIELVPV